MVDSKEFVIFFDKDNKNEFNTLNVAKELVDRYKVLGNPLILPESKSPNAPLIVFKEDTDFQIQISRTAVTVAFTEKHYKEASSIIFDIVDTFEDEKCKFERIGCIVNVFLNESYIDKVKEKFLNMDNFDEEMEEFNLSWYRKLDTKYGVINAWERKLTDKSSFNELLCQFDFNSVLNDKVDINMKYIKEFVRVTDEFIERRTSF